MTDSTLAYVIFGILASVMWIGAIVAHAYISAGMVR